METTSWEHQDELKQYENGVFGCWESDPKQVEGRGGQSIEGLGYSKPRGQLDVSKASEMWPQGSNYAGTLVAYQSRMILTLSISTCISQQCRQVGRWPEWWPWRRMGLTSDYLILSRCWTWKLFQRLYFGGEDDDGRRRGWNVVVLRLEHDIARVAYTGQCRGRTAADENIAPKV